MFYGMSGADGAKPDGFVAHMHIKRNNIFPGFRHAGACQLGGHAGLSVRRRGERGVKTVLRDTRPVDVLVEEPVHFVIAVQIHVARHVLIHNGLEIFGGCRLVVESLAIVLHHFFEEVIGIRIARIGELHAQHVEDVATLGVDQRLIGSPASFGGSNALSHPNGPKRFNGMILDILRLEDFFLLAPAIEIFLHVLSILNVEVSRKFRKAFGKPLIVVAFPSDAMAPPLVGAFVGTEEIGELNTVRKTDHMALCRIKKGGGPQVNQAGPALTIGIADRQAGDREMLVGIGAEIGTKETNGIRHLSSHGLGHDGRGERTYAVRVDPLYLGHYVIGLAVSVNFYVHLASLVAGDLVVSVRETSDSEWNFTFPCRDAGASVHGFAGFFSRGYQNTIFRAVKRQIKVGARRETVGPFRVPAGALTKVITAACFADGALSPVVKLKGLRDAGLQWMSQDNDDIITIRLVAVLVLPRLVETECASLSVFDGIDAEVGIQIENKHALA